MAFESVFIKKIILYDVRRSTRAPVTLFIHCLVKTFAYHPHTSAPLYAMTYEMFLVTYIFISFVCSPIFENNLYFVKYNWVVCLKIDCYNFIFPVDIARIVYTRLKFAAV